MTYFKNYQNNYRHDSSSLNNPSKSYSNSNSDRYTNDKESTYNHSSMNRYDNVNYSNNDRNNFENSNITDYKKPDKYGLFGGKITDKNEKSIEPDLSQFNKKKEIMEMLNKYKTKN